jgi:general secretion pathway protein G
MYSKSMNQKIQKHTGFLKHKKSRLSKGFTLLELLVVISIIGLILAMGTVAFMTAQQRGRDSKRRADMQAIQKGFEQFNAGNGSYDTCANMATQDFLPGGLPTDPRPGNAYVCNGDATTYCACAELEDAGSGNSSDSACSFAQSGDYFCVSALQ